MQITIQKRFLILVEVSENIFRVFLVIVNFVFNFVEKKIKETKENIWNFVEKTFNFVRALFGFNIYKLETIQIKTKTNFKNNFIKSRNQDFLIYSNLLAPPQKSFK